MSAIYFVLDVQYSQLLISIADWITVQLTCNTLHESDQRNYDVFHLKWVILIEFLREIEKKISIL